ncbi:putative WSC domain-containing protein [Colletotrichum sublineola]|uniref:Putative WSC domain-containing protein n=1 Tax=Colletotrichum sublineola TaxID=1173701 RepID=A0A066XFQ1_COLSU|nr:putative WSC domain-containing protein [Colletotrichum sublineola]
MRLSRPSGPFQWQCQKMIGIGLVILTFMTVAVSQALPRTQNDNAANDLAKQDTNVEPRQLQGAPWGLPWSIFDGGKSASPVSPAQPAMTTPLPAAAPAVPNNQPQGPLGGVAQVIPGVLASLTAVIGATTPGNVLTSASNAVPTLLQPGGPSGLPPAVPNGDAGQSPNSGGLLNPVQSLISTITGTGGNAGSPLSLSGVTSVLNPLATPVSGGILASQGTAVVDTRVPVVVGLPTITALSAAVSIITAAPGILPAATPSVNLGGLDAPQLPTELVGTPSLISSLINALTQDAASVPTVGGTSNQATNSLASAAYFPCTMVEFTNGTPIFIFTTCSAGASVAPPQTAASTALSSVAAPASSATISSLVLPGAPSTSAVLSSGGNTANLPVTSQVSLVITSGSSLAGTPQSSSTTAQPTSDIDNGSALSASSSQPGAGSQGSTAQSQRPNSTGQPQPPMTNSNAASNLTPVVQTPAGATQPLSQPNAGATSPTPQASAVSIQTTITVAAGPQASQPSKAPSISNSSPGSSSTPPDSSIFGVDDGQGSSPGGSAPPGTPVIPISDCPAVVQCPACPAPSAKPPSGSSCPCPGRGYSCSECLNGWFCPPQETPMLPAPCGMGWPCYHCKGGWYCAPDGNGGVPAGANNPPAVVITTITAFVLPLPTGPANGASSNGNGNGNGGSGNGSDNGSGNSSGNGSGGSGAGSNGGSPGNGVPASVGSGGAASTPCNTTSNTQPTSAAGSGNGSGNGNGAPNSPGNGASVSVSSGNGSSPTTSPTDPNSGSGSPPANGSPTDGGPPNNGSGNGSNDGQGSPSSDNPSSGYGNSPSASPATGNPNNGSGAGSGAPNGNGAPGPSNPATTAAGGNGGAGSGNPNAGPGGGTPSNAAPKAAPEVSGWTHLGCFKDSPIRTLDCDPSNYFAGSMSNEKCISHCASKGFRLAGTEYGKECWCGNAFQLAERIPQEQCNEVCDGRPTDICGGNWAVTVYSANGQALGVPSDDDTGNGGGSGNGSGNSSGSGSGSENTAGSGSPSTTPAGPLASSTTPPQTLPQGQPSPAPTGNTQPPLTPSASPSQPPQQQIDVVSLIKSIINALPKGSLDGGYGSGLGARDSGASGSNGSRSPGSAGGPDAGAGGLPAMGPGPVIPTGGLNGYGSQKRDVVSRSMKRSSIMERRAVAKSEGVESVGDTNGCGGNCEVGEV